MGTDPEEVEQWRRERRERWPFRQKSIVVDYESEEDATKKVPEPQKKKVCRYFLHTGKCRNGSRCAYSHDVSDRKVCLYYKKGQCRRGFKCFDSHNDHERFKDDAPLLEKLLHSQKRQEQDVILGILRHVVDRYGSEV